VNRRGFLCALASSGALAGLSCRAVKAKGRRPVLFTLSRYGCGRATAYSKSNKLVSIGQKTHAAWLDSQDGTFWARIRTLDRATGQWSPTYTVGEAHDNHGGPALAADADGHLHIVHFPHHHPFRYRRSRRPNDASAWTDEAQVGARCTYPCLVVRPDGTLLLTCRESTKAQWLLNLYHKPPDGAWAGPRTLFHGVAPKGYTQWQSSLAFSPDGAMLHMAWHIYEAGCGYAACYLRSPDGGESWQRSDGTKVELPATPATVDLVDGVRQPKKGMQMRAGGMAVGPDGTPWVPYYFGDRTPPEGWLARPDGKGGWHRIPLLPWIRTRWPERGIAFADNAAFDRHGTLYVALTTIVPDGKDAWGHPSREVVLLVSKDQARSFEAFEVSPPDPTTANWFPSLERPTCREPIGVPSLIYMHGEKGKGCDDILSNEVVFCDIPTLLRRQ